jgi:tetratricopeptide (TPR) repeat protein
MNTIVHNKITQKSRVILAVCAVTVFAFGGVAEAMQDVEQVIEELGQIINDNPDTPLADKVEDVLSKAQTALEELNKTPPDYQAAVGNIEGAVGDLEAAVKDGLLDAVQGTELMNLLSCAAWQIAAGAVCQAIDFEADADKIAEAEQALEEGEQLWIDGASKDAVSEYKDALAEAEGAVDHALDPLAELVTQNLMSEDGEVLGKALLYYAESVNETRIRLKCWDLAANAEYTGLLCEVDDDGNVIDCIELGSFTTDEDGKGSLRFSVDGNVSEWTIVVGFFISDSNFQIQMQSGPADMTIDSVPAELGGVVVIC